MAVVRLDGCAVNGRSDPNPSLGLSVSINLPGAPDGQISGRFRADLIGHRSLQQTALVRSPAVLVCVVTLQVTSQDQTAFQSCWHVCLHCSFQHAFSSVLQTQTADFVFSLFEFIWVSSIPQSHCEYPCTKFGDLISDFCCRIFLKSCEEISDGIVLCAKCWEIWPITPPKVYF